MDPMLMYIESNKYTRFSKFKDVEEFNNHFSQTMYFHKDKFTKAEIVALKKLKNFAYSEKSDNTVGVSWAKIQTIVAATHKDEFIGISRATFESMLRKAEKLNLVSVHNQFDKNKYKKHNVYVFNKFEELTPEKFEIVSKSDTINVSENEKIAVSLPLILHLPRIKENKRTYSPSESVPKEVVDKSVNKKQQNPTEYQQFVQKLDGLFKTKTEIYRLYGVWLSQKKTCLFNKPPVRLAKQALEVMTMEIKRRYDNNMKQLKNPVGYFNGVLSNMIDKWVEHGYMADIEELTYFE